MTSRVPVLVALALIGCDVGKAGDPPPGPLPPEDRFEHDMMVRFHMHENFDLLRAIEKLLIRGKLEEAMHLARAISEAPDEPGLGTWAPHAIKVRALAASLAGSPTIDEGCRRAARLSVACAGCHVAAGAMPELVNVPPTPPDKPTLEARMARHLWATDRLWEATLGGEDAPWLQGLDVLAATPLPFPATGDGRAALARRLQQLAATARAHKRGGLDSLSERGRVYGEILVTCATCHTAPAVPDLPSKR